MIQACTYVNRSESTRTNSTNELERPSKTKLQSIEIEVKERLKNTDNKSIASSISSLNSVFLVFVTAMRWNGIAPAIHLASMAKPPQKLGIEVSCKMGLEATSRSPTNFRRATGPARNASSWTCSAKRRQPGGRKNFRRFG